MVGADRGSASAGNRPRDGRTAENGAGPAEAPRVRSRRRNDAIQSVGVGDVFQAGGDRVVVSDLDVGVSKRNLQAQLAPAVVADVADIIEVKTEIGIVGFFQSGTGRTSGVHENIAAADLAG